MFRCILYEHLPEQKGRKLADRGGKCIFIEYDTKSKADKFYPLIKKVIVSRDIEFGHGQKKKDMLEICSFTLKMMNYEK